MNLSRVGSNRKRRANLLRRVKLSCQVGGKLGGWVGRKNGKRSESGRRIFIQFDRERIRMNETWRERSGRYRDPFRDNLDIAVDNRLRPEEIVLM